MFWFFWQCKIMGTFAASQVVLLLVYTENCPEHLGFRTSSHTNHVANLLVTPEFQVSGLVYLFSNQSKPGGKWKPIFYDTAENLAQTWLMKCARNIVYVRN